MFRIVDGIVFHGKPSADRWRVSVLELGHGQRECVVQRCIDWSDDCHLGPDSIDAQVLRGEREDPDAEEKRAANLRRAARRAKTRVRRLCKAMGLDTLLTLTYRANQTDLALCKRHFELFRKRMVNALGPWAFVAAFEPQTRGAWHVHIATHALPKLMTRRGVKVKSYNVVRAIWRDVVGDLGGNIDQSRRKGRAVPGHRVASYLSKYMTKNAELFEAGQRRFQASQIEIPAAQVVELRTMSLRELVELAYAFAADGACDVTTFLSPFGDTFYIASGPPIVDRSIHRRAYKKAKPTDHHADSHAAPAPAPPARTTGTPRSATHRPPCCRRC